MKGEIDHKSSRNNREEKLRASIMYFRSLIIRGESEVTESREHGLVYSLFRMRVT